MYIHFNMYVAIIIFFHTDWLLVCKMILTPYIGIYDCIYLVIYVFRVIICNYLCIYILMFYEFNPYLYICMLASYFLLYQVFL